MTDITLAYPPMPADADAGILKPSAKFRSQVVNVTFSIVLFVVVYLLLFMAAVAVAIASGALGIFIISVKVHFFTLLFGAGFILSGLMLVYFVIKFLFTSTPVDYSGMAEIKEEDHPRLFTFIRKLTEEAKAPFPKHIYISPEVNAAVFYDSSFWSMFFPVGKNLKIGLGLVNALNQSEFKAVMAHEFGHFSQRSMKFGSYVYNLNKVIYNMLYDNEGYGKAINAWAQYHAVLRITAQMNIWLIRGIQWVLRQFYIIINKNYLRLSREMEFHADAVSAYVSGSNHVISLLRRIQIADMSYNTLLQHWNSEIKNKNKSVNFYPQHLIIMQQFADTYNLELDVTGLPKVDKAIAALGGNQIEIEDQWASHPSTAEREQHAKAIGTTASTVYRPAWDLFGDPGALQEWMTQDMYSKTNTADFNFVDAEQFKIDYANQVNGNNFNKLYKGYYNARSITPFDVNEHKYIAAEMTFDELFNDEKSNLPNYIEYLKQDINLLENIANGTIKTNSFDYKGAKYSHKQATDVSNILRNELQQAEADLKEMDESAYHFFYSKATVQQQQQLTDKYAGLFAFQPLMDADMAMYDAMMNEMSPVYNTMKFEDIKATMDRVYKRESGVKPRLREIITDEAFSPYITAEQRTAIEKYLSDDWVYFNQPNYVEDALAVFNEAMQAFVAIFIERQFVLKKDLLEFQLQIIN